MPQRPLNVLYVNYGDFTTNSLNHIGGFANRLSALGHSCLVGVRQNRESASVLRNPLFATATFDEILRTPNHFPDSRPADIIHAWTPRESVRRFVGEYTAKWQAPIVIHLEDNEIYLLESYYRESFDKLRGTSPIMRNATWTPELSHPVRFREFLYRADGATVITPALTDFIPDRIPQKVISPPVDFSFFKPQASDPARRKSLGIGDEEKIVVFQGSITSANRADIRNLYLAIKTLNDDGIPTKLIRTGFSDPEFGDSFSFDIGSIAVELGFVERDQLPELLALADILIQPGRADEFNRYRLPSKIPEFLASGRPTLVPATNIGLELVNGEEALLIRDGSPDEIAKLCRRVFSDDRLARRLAQGGVAFARKHFDPATVTTELLDFYNHILRGRESGPIDPVDTFIHSLPAETDEKLLRECRDRLDDAELIARDQEAEQRWLEKENRQLIYERRLLADKVRRMLRWATQKPPTDSELPGSDGFDFAPISREFDQAVDSAKALARKIDEQDKRLQYLDEEIRKLNGDIKTFQQEREELHAVITLETQAKAEFQRTSKQVKQELVTLKNSFIWKVTTPLRFLGQTIPGPWRRKKS